MQIALVMLVALSRYSCVFAYVFTLHFAAHVVLMRSHQFTFVIAFAHLCSYIRFVHDYELLVALLPVPGIASSREYLDGSDKHYAGGILSI